MEDHIYKKFAEEQLDKITVNGTIASAEINRIWFIFLSELTKKIKKDRLKNISLNISAIKQQRTVSNPHEMGNKWGEPYEGHSFLAWDSFLPVTLGVGS